jgi:hypothetical protein
MCPDSSTTNWKELYIAAILGIDSTNIFSRIRDAKMAICDRVEELNGGGGAAERTALNRAMKALNDLQDVYSSKPHQPPQQFLQNRSAASSAHGSEEAT